MATERITPDEAAARIEQGWTYVDVRSIPEFEQGHPAGAYNVPFMHRTARGMQPNGDFLAVMAATFPKDTQLVIGCQSGNRSLRAAEALAQAGYHELVEMRGGYGGERRGAEVVVAGWRERSLPVAQAAQAGRDYEALKAGADQSA
ncbi:MAG: hypothetical protein Tsb0020_25000 [Haliangiales bacterium]